MSLLENLDPWSGINILLNVLCPFVNNSWVLLTNMCFGFQQSGNGISSGSYVLNFSRRLYADIVPILKSIEVPKHLTHGSFVVKLCRTLYISFLSCLSHQFESITGNKSISSWWLYVLWNSSCDLKSRVKEQLSLRQATKPFYHLDSDLTRTVGRDHQSQ